MSILSIMGIKVGIVMMPILPYITDTEENIINIVNRAFTRWDFFDVKVIVYNQQVYPDGIDPLDVKIPWAFSEGSVDRAMVMLREALRLSLLENESRTWRTTDGGIEVVASFVSADDTHVTLKKTENEEVITLGVSRLTFFDQGYVRLRLLAEKGEVEFGKFDFSSISFINDNSPFPPKLRTWRFFIGNAELRAKYISSDGTNVTLEHENGRNMTTLITLFSPEDQEYIKQRLAGEKQQDSD
jgi:hypothetical protein